MPDVWANIAEADTAVQESLANVLGLVESDSEMQASLEAFIAEVDYPPKARVLEIGSGTGRLARAVAKRPDVEHVTGSDPSPVLTQKARELAASFANLTFEEMDGRKLSFQAGVFDVVFIVRTLLHIPGPEQVLSEAYRVLRPGGTLAILDGDGDATTVAIGENDPLQNCLEAALTAYLNDAWIVRRLPALLRSSGFELLGSRNHGIIKTADANVVLSQVDRGADVLAARGVIGPDLAAALKSEARRRIDAGAFFALSGQASFISRKPA